MCLLSPTVSKLLTESLSPTFVFFHSLCVWYFLSCSLYKCACLCGVIFGYIFFIFCLPECKSSFVLGIHFRMPQTGHQLSAVSEWGASSPKFPFLRWTGCFYRPKRQRALPAKLNDVFGPGIDHSTWRHLSIESHRGIGGVQVCARARPCVCVSACEGGRWREKGSYYTYLSLKMKTFWGYIIWISDYLWHKILWTLNMLSRQKQNISCSSKHIKTNLNSLELRWLIHLSIHRKCICSYFFIGNWWII